MTVYYHEMQLVVILYGFIFIIAHLNPDLIIGYLLSVTVMYLFFEILDKTRHSKTKSKRGET